jgi:hypothetical protein
MALSNLKQSVFNPPYGIDETATRMWLRGKFVFSGSGGTYATGGLLPNWGNTTANILDPLADASGQNVLIPTYTQPGMGLITAVTSASSGATTTIYTATTPLANQFVTFSGLTTATALNGKTLQVVSVSAGVSFVVASSVPTQSKTADTGVAATVIGPDDMEIHSVSGSGYIYQYNKSLATIQVFSVGGGTPAGTISAPTITTTSGGVAVALGVTAGALSEVTGASGITGVQAPTFTGTPGTSGPASELAASTTPAGVTGDVIHFVATWAKQ